MHQRRGDEAEAQALPEPICGALQDPLQHPAAKGSKPLLKRQHPKEKDRHPRRDELKLGTDPKTVGENDQNRRKKYSSKHDARFDVGYGVSIAKY